MVDDLIFPWSRYKSTNDSRFIYLGEVQIYTMREGGAREPGPRWIVKICSPMELRVDRDKPLLVWTGLTDKRFKTRREAQEAVERVFISIARIAPYMVKVPKVDPVLDWRSSCGVELPPAECREWK